ncbi:unnamed protein product, partial [Choristocarpus tenellus]
MQWWIIYTGTDLQHEDDIHPHWQHIMVIRTLTVWEEDGGCLVKIVNFSQKGIKLPAEFVVGHVSPVSKTYTLSDTTVSAVAATPSTPEELKQAREELKLVFSKK